MKAASAFWKEKRVLITGHTGFKGAWLAQWLADLGADICGIALAPETEPALFNQLELESRLDHHIADIRDAGKLRDLVHEFAPQIVFHLAAQPLVIRSYEQPLETYETNVMGTANLLDAVRLTERKCTVVVITTDKVYDNKEWEFGYRETDPLGGHDPYSSSKAASELVADSYRRSFFKPAGKVGLSTARAGNVIGGGDWSDNRILPDIARALSREEAIRVRNPASVRPWQHVLDPLHGYMTLAQQMYERDDQDLWTSFNFGPAADAEKPVGELVEAALRSWPGQAQFDEPDGTAVHEAGRLALNIDRATQLLGWKPNWGFERAVSETIAWYKVAQNADNEEIQEFTRRQIKEFVNDL